MARDYAELRSEEERLVEQEQKYPKFRDRLDVGFLFILGMLFSYVVVAAAIKIVKGLMV